MPLPYLAIALFGLAALILIWLGRYTHRESPRTDSPVAVGMTEAEVLAALGPPEEVRRDGDPLDTRSSAGGIHASYVYPGLGLVRFVDGVVQEIGEESPLPEVDGEAAPTGGSPRGLVGIYYPAAPTGGSLLIDEVEEVEAIPLEDEFPSAIPTE